MTTAAPSPDDVLATVDTLGPPGTPVTTPEVADGFDCTKRTTYNRLEALVEDNVLKTKKVGANSRVWWRPAEIEQGRSEDSHEERAQGHSLPVFDSEMIGVVVWDSDVKISDANDAFLDMTGLDYEEALGTSWRELTPEEFYAASERHLLEVEEEGSGVPYEKQYYRADGSRWWGLFESRRLNDSQTVEFVVDITEQKHLEQSLQSEKERIDVAVMNSPLTIWQMDTDLRYTWLKHPHPEFEVADVLGKRDDELLSPDAAETVLKPKRRAMETGEKVREEVSYTLPTGEAVSYDLTVAPLRDERREITGVTCAAFDITERKEAEDALRESQERLEALVTTTTDLVYRMSPDWSDVYSLDGGCSSMTTTRNAWRRGWKSSSPRMNRNA